MELTRSNVQKIMLEALPGKENEPGCIKVDGVVATYLLKEDVLSKYKNDIIDMLHQLPDKFTEEHQGYSFLEACMTKSEEHWGEHRDIEALMVLGIGIKRVVVPLPKEVWFILPGGVPYFYYTEKDVEVKEKN